MTRRRALTITALAAGLGAAWLLLWLGRDRLPPPGPGPTAGRPVVAAAAATGAAPERIDPAVAALLAALERALAAGDARSREAVLTFKDDDALRRFLDRAGRAGLTVVTRLDRLRAARVRFDRFSALRDDLVAHGGDYASAGANNLIRVPTVPLREDRAAVEHVPFGNETLAFLGAGGDRSAWGRGVTIAILDTGVAADATFGSGRLRSLDLGLGLAPGAGGADGHGTAVAALAAGQSADAPGVAPAASLLSIRVTDANGLSDLFTLAQAIVAAVDQGARVINISLGGHATGPVLDAAIGYATQRGAVLVAAAGNDQAAQLAWPAADPRVVSVGAVDRSEQQVIFSNSGAQLQLSAPGYGVQTAWVDRQRVYVDGTSASAPLVAGAIAALTSQTPGLSPADAAQVLARTANDAGRPGGDPAYGQGIINLATAMNRGNPAWVDTAVSSHFHDEGTGRVQLVVQNRSGRTMSGLTLNATVGGAALTLPVPSLAPGESYVAAAPVDPAALAAAGRLPVSTQLVNPPGTVDQVPANNQRSSVLQAPGRP